MIYSAICRYYSQQLAKLLDDMNLYPRDIGPVLNVALADTPVVCLQGLSEVQQ